MVTGDPVAHGVPISYTLFQCNLLPFIQSQPVRYLFTRAILDIDPAGAFALVVWW